MGSCCSCLKQNIEIQDVLIREDDNPEGFPVDNGQAMNMPVNPSNSTTNIVTFVDGNLTSSSSECQKFPFLKNRLINIPYNLKKEDYTLPPIGTVLDESNSYSIVFFGDTDTGKTTFFNQFRLYIDDFTESERKSYVLRIMVSIIESIQKIYAYLKNNDKSVSFQNENLIDEINQMKTEELRKSYTIPQELFGKLSTVWKDPLISDTFSENWAKLHLCQFVPEFITKMSTYEESNYVPENTEILQTKMCTINNNINNRINDENYLETATLQTSPQMLAFSYRDMILLLRDAGGSKLHRDKWKNFTYDGGFFFVSLGDFNQPVLNDPNESKIATNSSSESINSNDDKHENEFQIFESLSIFKKTITKFFPGPQKPLFVLLTKFDLFEKIIQNDSECFKKVFPDFDGDVSSPDQCQKYIANLFAKAAQECNPDLKINICTTIDCLNQTSVFLITKKIVKKLKKYG